MHEHCFYIGQQIEAVHDLAIKALFWTTLETLIMFYSFALFTIVLPKNGFT